MKKKLTELNLETLDSFEMKNIEGGWNLLEYLAMGYGYLESKLNHAPVGPVEYRGGSFRETV